MRAAYEFSESWTVPADAPTVREVLADVERYPEWWPQVLAVVYLGPDDGRVLCRSTLPYTLDLLLHAVVRDAERLEVEVDGDLRGRICWHFAAGDGGTRVDFEQQVEVRGALAVASLVGRPVLRWNHRRMMSGCRAGLVARLGERAC